MPESAPGPNSLISVLGRCMTDTDAANIEIANQKAERDVLMAKWLNKIKEALNKA